ncbi:MarR family winged helix-turn-helix transcriptional regulator [Dactylosporangium sp. CA-092794]|uniref:MarR family winged helix-turn-helix transcriptional regulator n=1 Tax=Dactylosporangium sp. CA-092794 TaxID=3239929 RepID=UPI003D935B2D
MTTPDAASTARDLIVVFRRLRVRLRQVSSGGLTPSQAAVLIRLNRDGPSSTTVLALAEGVRSQSMTATLNALEELGLIERAPDPEDGRRQIITLSESGKRRAVEEKAGRNEWLVQEMDRRYTPAQLATITEAVALLGELVEE